MSSIAQLITTREILSETSQPGSGIRFTKNLRLKTAFLLFFALLPMLVLPALAASDDKSKIAMGAAHIIAIKSDGTLWAWGDNEFGQLGDGSLVNNYSPHIITGSDNDHNWHYVATGGMHTVAIKEDGTLWAWGDNEFGQLGIGSNDNQSSPQKVHIPPSDGADNDWASVSAGGLCTIAIKTDGTLWAWGNNSYGQLGNESTDTNIHNVPVKIGSDHWVSVSARRAHIIAIKTDGTLWTWGDNSSGQLGLGPTVTDNKNSPQQVSSESWIYVSAGVDHSTAIKADGTLWAWGRNASGQLGLGPLVTDDQTTPQKVGSDTDWVSVAAGVEHTLAIKQDGTLWAWGNNVSGQLGLGSTDNWDSPQQVGNYHWDAVATRPYHCIAIKADGTFLAWGDNSSGQLGDGTTTDQHAPVQICLGNCTVIAAPKLKIATGDSYTVAIKTDRTLWTWGNNSSGQLGNGSTDNDLHNIPGQVFIQSPQSGLNNDWDSVATGGDHTVAIKTDGTLWAWGDNSLGQLGLGPSEPGNKDSPQQVGSDTDWATVSAGCHYTVAIKTDGTLWAWGNNSYGQLGNGTTDNNIHNIPVQIGSAHWAFVSVRRAHIIAIKTDGTLWTWGDNSSGQLGIGTTDSDNDHNTPVQVFIQSPPVGVVDNDWVYVSAGVDHSTAIKEDGTLWAWGRNASGQLGLGPLVTDDQNTPQKVGSDTNWVSVAAGVDHTLAIKTNGTLWAWGDNSYGQLGVNSTTPSNIPVQVFIQSPPVGVVDNDWDAVATRPYNCIAIKTNGTLWTWGDNYFGQLGDGTTTEKHAPVQICLGNCTIIDTDTTSPTAPTNLSWTGVTTSSVTLSWNASSDNVGVAGYHIYNAFNAALVATTSNTSYEVTGLTAGGTYSFYVTAYDAAGNQSLASNLCGVILPNTISIVPAPVGDNVEIPVPVTLPSGGTVTVIVEFNEIPSGGGGDLSIAAVSTPPASPPSGFAFLGTIFYISTTATYTPPVLVTFPYNPSQVVGSESNLKLFHRENGQWVDVTVSVDTVNHTITGQVNTISPFGIGYPLGSGYSTGANTNMIALLAIFAITMGVFIIRKYRVA